MKDQLQMPRALQLTRQFHRLSQSELAERLGVSKSHISELESGKKTPSVDLLKKYAEVFDIPPSTLLLFAERLNGDIPARQKAKVEKVLRFLELVAGDE